MLQSMNRWMPLATVSKYQPAIEVAQPVSSPSTSRQFRAGQSRTTMFKRRKIEWPDPEQSIGRARPSHSTSGCCWEAIGPARDAFDKIAEKIKELFQNQSDYLDEGEETSPTFSYDIWMVGRDKSRAIPTIILGCQSSNVRDKAKTLLNESGILDSFPGINVKKTRRAPDRLAANDDTRELGRSESRPEDIDTVYAVEEEDQCGVQIFLANAFNLPNKSAAKATIGGIVTVDSVAYGLSVSHVFASSYRPPEDLLQDDLLVFDEDSDSDTISFAESTSKGSVSPPATLTRSSEMSSSEDGDTYGTDFKLQNFTVDTNNTVNHQPSSPMRHYKMLGNLFARSGDSGPDWALIKLIGLSRTYRNKIPLSLQDREGTNSAKFYVYPEKVAPCLVDSSVLIATGRAGTIKGYISATPTFIRLAGCSSFLKVWPVTSDQTLEIGDCGAWVVNSHDGDLYGHVVAGNPGSKLGYIVAAHNVFDDVKLNQGIRLRLPAMNHNDEAEIEPLQGGQQSSTAVPLTWSFIGKTKARQYAGSISGAGVSNDDVFRRLFDNIRAGNKNIDNKRSLPRTNGLMEHYIDEFSINEGIFHEDI